MVEIIIQLGSNVEIIKMRIFRKPGIFIVCLVIVDKVISCVLENRQLHAEKVMSKVNIGTLESKSYLKGRMVFR